MLTELEYIKKTITLFYIIVATYIFQQIIYSMFLLVNL